MNNVILSSVEKNSKGDTVFSIYCNNKNEFRNIKYIKGTIGFNIGDGIKKNEPKNYTERMVYNYINYGNNAIRRQYVYEGMLKVLSIDNSEVLIEFIGKSTNDNDFLKYVDERKELLLKKLEEEKEKERLANRKINRRFHF